eukprot:CAMPEP_0119342826 /NCGR_PEP_ID=MMETSP1333-20130426/105527_1 /TAXON_ID=418940 /ORGANISM="Scyphosphaera apsteinii, Strain RCC1455" /LENGTH=170 /DNA_ID=CAMNT_0007355119 /DNA_START=241 /DNA_END=756 /DNA_ORIENTATION=-
MVRPESAGTINEFMQNNAETIVLSSWRPGQVRREDDGTFEIDVEEFAFLSLKISVVLRARVWYDAATSTANFQSCGFRLTGLDGMNDAINVLVKGSLRPSPPQSTFSALSGSVEFVASGAVPSLLRSAPEGALRTATRVISESLVSAASERFDVKVPAAYREWARSRGPA